MLRKIVGVILLVAGLALAASSYQTARITSQASAALTAPGSALLAYELCPATVVEFSSTQQHLLFTLHNNFPETMEVAVEAMQVPSGIDVSVAQPKARILPGASAYIGGKIMANTAPGTYTIVYRVQGTTRSAAAKIKIEQHIIVQAAPTPEAVGEVTPGVATSTPQPSPLP